MIKSTEQLKNEIKSADNIQDYINNNKENMINYGLTSYLQQLLEQKDMTKACVVKNSLLDRNYIYQIFNGTRHPSRDTLIALCFSMQLNLEETQNALKISIHRELYPRDNRDSIIIFAIDNMYDIIKANILLSENGFSPICK